MDSKQDKPQVWATMTEDQRDDALIEVLCSGGSPYVLCATHNTTRRVIAAHMGSTRFGQVFAPISADLTRATNLQARALSMARIMNSDASDPSPLPLSEIKTLSRYGTFTVDEDSDSSKDQKVAVAIDKLQKNAWKRQFLPSEPTPKD